MLHDLVTALLRSKTSTRGQQRRMETQRKDVKTCSVVENYTDDDNYNDDSRKTILDSPSSQIRKDIRDASEKVLTVDISMRIDDDDDDGKQTWR